VYQREGVGYPHVLLQIATLLPKPPVFCFRMLLEMICIVMPLWNQASILENGRTNCVIPMQVFVLGSTMVVVPELNPIFLQTSEV
jgi:hypothetical protein